MENGNTGRGRSCCRTVSMEGVEAAERQVVDFREDFDFPLDLRGCDGVAVAVPGCDFSLSLYVRGRAARYVAGRFDGELRNCYVDPEGLLHVVADGHGLPAGALRGLLTMDVTDERYSDRSRHVAVELDLGIDLIAGTPCVCSARALHPVVAQMPVAGMEEITEDEVMALMASLGGDALTGEPLRPATDGEIDALFNRTYTSEEETDYGDGE